MAEQPYPPNALSPQGEYSDIQRFITSRLLMEADHGKIEAMVSYLAGEWVVLKITGEKNLNDRSVEIAKAFSDIFMGDTSGYWK